MKFGLRAAAVTLAATTSVLAGSAAARAADGEDLTCTSEHDGGVYGNVTVPAEATCTLRNATVHGCISLPSPSGLGNPGALTLANTAVDGGLDVAGSHGNGISGAEVNVTSSTIKGAVEQSDGSFTATDSNLGSLRAQNTQLTRSTVSGDVKVSGRGAITVEESTMDGIEAHLKDSVRVNNSTVTKKTDLSAAVIHLCGSRLSTTQLSASYILRVGDGQDCAGNTVNGDLTVSSLASTTRFYNNTVTGFTSSPEDHPGDLQGSANTFAGGVKGALATLP